MTLPDERYRAVKWAQGFLSRLASGQYPRTPRAVRDEARSILRHYPNDWDMNRAAESAPAVFQQRMEDLHRMIATYEQVTPEFKSHTAAEQQPATADDQDELMRGYRE